MVLEVEKLRSLRDELARARTTSKDVRSSVRRTQNSLQDLMLRAMTAEGDAEKLRNQLAAADEQVLLFCTFKSRFVPNDDACVAHHGSNTASK